MNDSGNGNGLFVYDPRGVVEAGALPLSARPTKVTGLRLAVLDNTKWNARQLLESTVELLKEELSFAAVNVYKKESFSLAATPELLAEIAADNDLALTAVGD